MIILAATERHKLNLYLYLIMIAMHFPPFNTTTPQFHLGNFFQLNVEEHRAIFQFHVNGGILDCR